MSTHTVGRLGAAAILAVGLLITTAIPSSATVTNVAITASSTIDFHNVYTSATTGYYHIEGHATNKVCAPNSTPSNAMLFDFDSYGGATVGASSTTYDDFAIGANTFKVRMNIISGTMTLATSNATLDLLVNFEFRNCASTTLLCRTHNRTLSMWASNPTGTRHPTFSTTFWMGGSSNWMTFIAVPSCNIIIRSALLDSNAVASLGLHVLI